MNYNFKFNSTNNISVLINQKVNGLDIEEVKSKLKTSHLFDEIALQAIDCSFFDDIIDDCREIFTGGKVLNRIHYPESSMTTSNFIIFDNDNQDQFLKVLSDSYNRNKIQKLISNYKITFITSDSNSLSKTIEFENENDYLIAILSLKRMYNKEEICYTGKCFILQTNIIEKSLINRISSSTESHYFEAKTPYFRVFGINNKVEYIHFNMNSIKAITISSDYELIRSNILRISLVSTNNQLNINVKHNNEAVNIDNKSIYYDKSSEKVSAYIPISKDDVENNCLLCDSNKIAINRENEVAGIIIIISNKTKF
jgi:hypothetical protein